MKYAVFDKNKQRGGRAGRKVSFWGRGMAGLGSIEFCKTCGKCTPRETINGVYVCCVCKG